MRRSLIWLTAIPLMLAGSQVAHLLAYRWAYPDMHFRLRVMLASGHSYFDYAPAAVGVAGAALLVSLVLSVVDAARGRAQRSLPPCAFAVLPPLAFLVQEHVERWLHTGVFPWFTVLDPTFLPGLLLQLPFGLAAYVLVRLFVRAAVKLGHALAKAPTRTSLVRAASPRPPYASDVRRVPVLARGWAGRGPPLATPAA